MNASILIVDDEHSICEALTFALRSTYSVTCCEDPQQVLSLLRKESFDVILLDLRLGAYSGMDILREIKSAGLNSAVVMMTAFGNERSSVEAMRLGAFDYLTKPLDLDELKIVLAKALEFMHISEQVDFLENALKEKNAGVKMVVEDPKTEQIMKMMERICDVDSTVLITGESGTGKEVVARKIHESGKRKDQRFVVINCAAIPENLLESELFGYKKGAFTGANADRKGKITLAEKGTLFLDEIGDMPLSLQAKILRVIQEKVVLPVGGQQETSVDVRLIAATNQDLQKKIAEGTFREDLYYRLNVIELRLPSLRERKGDILPLCSFFIEKYNAEMKKSVKGLSAQAQKVLLDYDYPGNVRQLENIIERAMILTNGDEIGVLALAEEVTRQTRPEKDEYLMQLLNGKTLKDVEKLMITGALKTNKDKAEAAQMLGISERTIWNKIKEYQIDS